MPETITVTFTIQKDLPLIEGDEDGQETIDAAADKLEAEGWSVEVDDMGDEGDDEDGPPVGDEG